MGTLDLLELLPLGHPKCRFLGIVPACDESKVHQINSVVNAEDSEYKAAAMSRKHSFIGVMYRTKCEVDTRKFIQIGSMQVEC
jgi:hypothetical protein